MLELSVKLRQETGSKNETIRKQGLIPAVLYGHKVKNLNLSVKGQDFEKIYKQAGESALIKLDIAAAQDKTAKVHSAKGGERVVLVHALDKDPVSDKIIHIDFYQVKMDEMTSVEVPLVFVGKSEAVETNKGVLIRNIQAVEIEALPQDLPSEIEVDISVLKTFDDNIYIKDLKIPEKAKIKNNPEDSVASVIPPRTTAELEDLEEAPAETTEEVEVSAKGGPASGGEGKKLEQAEEESETTKQDKEEKPAEQEPASSGKQNE